MTSKKGSAQGDPGGGAHRAGGAVKLEDDIKEEHVPE